MTRNSPSLNAEISEGYLEVNPADASHMEISQGDSVKVTSRRGHITAKTMVTERVREGMVFMPFHFVESNANVLTNPAHDPTVRIPEFKVCAVKVERA
jgi:predicted molibdopterin-dependent oxidoreductase YjgC